MLHVRCCTAHRCLQTCSASSPPLCTDSRHCTVTMPAYGGASRCLIWNVLIGNHASYNQRSSQRSSLSAGVVGRQVSGSVVACLLPLGSAGRLQSQSHADNLSAIPLSSIAGMIGPQVCGTWAVRVHILTPSSSSFYLFAAN